MPARLASHCHPLYILMLHQLLRFYLTRPKWSCRHGSACCQTGPWRFGPNHERLPHNKLAPAFATRNCAFPGLPGAMISRQSLRSGSFHQRLGFVLFAVAAACVLVAIVVPIELQRRVEGVQSAHLAIFFENNYFVQILCKFYRVLHSTLQNTCARAPY